MLAVARRVDDARAPRGPGPGAPRPGRIAARPAACACSTRPCSRRKVSSGPMPAAPATHDRARDVRAVARAPPADVEQQRLAGTHDPVGDVVVGRGGVRAAGHDPELGGVVALRDEALLDLPRQVRLRAADEPAADASPRPSGPRHAAAARSSSSSSASLTWRSGLMSADATLKRAAGSAAWRRSRNAARSPSETSRLPVARCGAQESAATSANGSSVSPHGDQLHEPRRRARRGLAAPTSRRGTTSVARPLAGTPASSAARGRPRRSP